jgi:HD-GYP domain-containing protein (c-di-GMP phosphodiesterase class II)
MVFLISRNFYRSIDTVEQSYDDVTSNYELSETILTLTDDVSVKIIDYYSKSNQDLVIDVYQYFYEVDNSLVLLKNNVSNDDSAFSVYRLINIVAAYRNEVDLFFDNVTSSELSKASANVNEIVVINDSINTVLTDILRSELNYLDETMVERGLMISLTKRNTSTVVVLLFLFLIAILIYNLNQINMDIRKIEVIHDEVKKGNFDYISTEKPSISEFMSLFKSSINMKNALNELTSEVNSSKTAIISAVGSLAEIRDNETGTHINDVQLFLSILCDQLIEDGIYIEQLTDTYVETVIQVSPLHDIGKVGISDDILLKPGKLTFEEFEIMKTHVVIGERAIKNAYDHYSNRENSFFSTAINVIGDHHEKWDGTGYPRGKKEVDISLAGRLVSIVDVYDALTSERVYKRTYSHEEAVQIIEELRGIQFDPQIVDAFIRCEKNILNASLKQ